MRRAESAELDSQETESQRDHYHTLSQFYEAAVHEIFESVVESKAVLAGARVVIRGWTEMYPRVSIVFK